MGWLADSAKKAASSVISRTEAGRKEGATRIQKGEGKKGDVYGDAAPIAAERARKEKASK